jgi:GNAT superfamily N-acetyltransferase
MAALSDAELLTTFDRQIRRRPGPEVGFEVELVTDPAPVLRMTPTATDASWGGGVFWCDLDESNADAAIAAAVEHFRPFGREFEWKHYGYDEPRDLTDRLAAAGLAPDEEEALVVGEVAVVRERLASAPDPVGITIRRLRTDADGGAADWQGINDLGRAVWDEDTTDMNRTVAAAIAADPQATSMWLAVAEDGTVVCAARANFHEGTDFASLWGGSTLEEYRGRGIYKALVSRRADEAAERGYRFLQVDASPDSRPILERLGLRTLTSTTPWMWRAEATLGS